jgi:hypothetical protein
MDREIIEYRQKHPKCKWCKYYKHHYCYDTCELKNKIIYFINLLRLCKYYQVEEEEEKNEIKTTRSK